MTTDGMVKSDEITWGLVAERRIEHVVVDYLLELDEIGLLEHIKDLRDELRTVRELLREALTVNVRLTTQLAHGRHQSRPRRQSNAGPVLPRVVK